MIDINLVPITLRKKSGQGILSGLTLNLPQEILLGVGGGFVLLLLAVHLLLGSMMVVNLIRVGVSKAQWQELLPDKNALDAIGNEVKDLKKKMNTINDITTKHSIGWSRNLNVISDNLTTGAWLKRITVDSKALVIEGCVFSKVQNEIVTVGSLVSSLKKDDGFMKAFQSVEVDSIQRNKLKVTEVADFNVSVKLK